MSREKKRTKKSEVAPNVGTLSRWLAFDESLN